MVLLLVISAFVVDVDVLLSSELLLLLLLVQLLGALIFYLLN